MTREELYKFIEDNISSFEDTQLDDNKVAVCEVGFEMCKLTGCEADYFVNSISLARPKNRNTGEYE